MTLPQPLSIGEGSIKGKNKLFLLKHYSLFSLFIFKFRFIICCNSSRLGRYNWYLLTNNCEEILCMAYFTSSSSFSFANTIPIGGLSPSVFSSVSKYPRYMFICPTSSYPASSFLRSISTKHFNIRW